MSSFSLRYPYFIIVVCLMTVVIGITSVVRMPVDLFPEIKIPVVVVATFYPGMPPEQIEQDLTARLERFFTLASGIEHIESRSLPGTSLIKIYFQPGVNADSAVSTIGNLAIAELRRLPPGTLPPVVLKFDASSQPVCLITLKGEGMNEAQLRDVGHYKVRTQVATVPGASLPQPFGGRYRQIMIYVDPMKLEANQLSVMDVVRSVNDSNLILPAGDVRIGPLNFNIYANSQLETLDDITRIPLKTVGQSSVMVGDVGEVKDHASLQYSTVRVDGQRSAYQPVLRQGGDANTIAVVDGIKEAVKHLVDIPKELKTDVVFDQSIFVKNAIENLVHEGGIGLVLTGLMILLFLGSLRSTIAVFLSIPLSVLATFIVLALGGGTVNTMILGGLALAFSRLIDNSVIVLENIFRHLELGEGPKEAAIHGGREVAMPVLSATLTTAVVFLPVIFLYGPSRYLFMALALAVVVSLFASYLIALTVVPLFCGKLLKARDSHQEIGGKGFHGWFNRRFQTGVNVYSHLLRWSLKVPVVTVLLITAVFAASLLLYPLIGMTYFPRTDPAQFMINLKAPSGTRLEVTEQHVIKVEQICREEVAKEDIGLIVSNIGITPDFSAIYNANSAQHTAIVQVSLQEKHRVGSYEYMNKVRERIRKELPELTAYFQSGGLVDAVLNLGQPAPIDIQVSGSKMDANFKTAANIARQVKALPGVADALIPIDMDYPAIRLDLDRKRIAELGLSAKEVVQNIITALLSNGLIAPTFYADPASLNDYYLVVQYPENYVQDFNMLKAIPIRAPGMTESTRLDAVASIRRITGPTQVDHHQLRKVVHLFVSSSGEDLGRVMKDIDRIIAETTVPEGSRIDVRGMVQGMNASFKTFGLGLLLAVVLVYLILVSQFQSFIDPFLILLAVPTGLAGVIVTLWLTGTTLNVMSLMGVVMMVGIVVSNSILIVEFARHLHQEGRTLHDALIEACRVRLRPILMTSLATLIGLLPMALKLGTGSEAYAPLARAIIGGLAVSVVLTLFIVPAAYLIAHRNRKPPEQHPHHHHHTQPQHA
ncbi:MAG: efflux RND transporter permease subunit [Verrucomicrobiaceae bacterium]|nr:efflux RND transporter permease subunit [Verrucomicrobiaceae bacterium]